MMASWFELDKVAAEKDVAEEALKIKAEAEAIKRQKKKQKSSLLLLLKRKSKPLM